MKFKLFVTVVLLGFGAVGGIFGKGYIEKKNAGEDVTLASEVTDVAANTIEFVDGKLITNPVTGKQWMVISQEKLNRMLSEAWEKGQRDTPRMFADGSVPDSQPVPVVQPVKPETHGDVTP